MCDDPYFIVKVLEIKLINKLLNNFNIWALIIFIQIDSDCQLVCEYNKNSSNFSTFYKKVVKNMSWTAAWLAHLIERRTAVREVESLSPGLDQHSGS